MRSSGAPHEAVIGCIARGRASGRAYADLLDTDNFTSRYDAVMRTVDEGEGVPYQIEYLFRPDGRNGQTAYWLEEPRRWYAGDDGRPAEAFGIVRRIDDRHSRDQQLSFLGNCDPLTGMMNRGRMAEALGRGDRRGRPREGVSRASSSPASTISPWSTTPMASRWPTRSSSPLAAGSRRWCAPAIRSRAIRAASSPSSSTIATEEELQPAAERFLEVARESVIETEHGPVWAMLSIGAIVLPGHAADANTAMARTEEALTEAKRLPSDGFVIYKPSQKLMSERSINAACARDRRLPQGRPLQARLPADRRCDDARSGDA